MMGEGGEYNGWMQTEEDSDLFWIFLVDLIHENSVYIILSSSMRALEQKINEMRKDRNHRNCIHEMRSRKVRYRHISPPTTKLYKMLIHTSLPHKIYAHRLCTMSTCTMSTSCIHLAFRKTINTTLHLYKSIIHVYLAVARRAFSGKYQAFYNVCSGFCSVTVQLPHPCRLSVTPPATATAAAVTS